MSENGAITSKKPARKMSNVSVDDDVEEVDTADCGQRFLLSLSLSRILQSPSFSTHLKVPHFSDLVVWLFNSASLFSCLAVLPELSFGPLMMVRFSRSSLFLSLSLSFSLSLFLSQSCSLDLREVPQIFTGEAGENKKIHKRDASVNFTIYVDQYSEKKGTYVVTRRAADKANQIVVRGFPYTYVVLHRVQI